MAGWLGLLRLGGNHTGTWQQIQPLLQTAAYFLISRRTFSLVAQLPGCRFWCFVPWQMDGYAKLYEKVFTPLKTNNFQHFKIAYLQSTSVLYDYLFMSWWLFEYKYVIIKYTTNVICLGTDTISLKPYSKVVNNTNITEIVCVSKRLILSFRSFKIFFNTFPFLGYYIFRIFLLPSPTNISVVIAFCCTNKFLVVSLLSISRATAKC